MVALQNGRAQDQWVEIGMGITVAIVEITPSIAESWLATMMPQQRKTKDGHLKSLTRDIENGRWKFTGETVIFDSNGHLVDGRHRLMACVKTGIPIVCVVIKGIPPESYGAIDNSVKRSGADALKAEGALNTITVASIVSISLTYKMGVSMHHQLSHSPQAIAEEYQLSPAVYDQATLAASKLRSLRQGLQVFGLCYILMSQIDKEGADEFFDRLATGEGLQKGDPVLTIRNYFIKTKATRYEALMAMFKAWNCRRSGKAMFNVSFRVGDQLPTLI